MKALMRRKGETILEDYDLNFIDWRNGAPLTNAGWSGGPYILVDDYVLDDPADDATPAPAVPEGHILVDGQLYKKC